MDTNEQPDSEKACKYFCGILNLGPYHPHISFYRCSLDGWIDEKIGLFSNGEVRSYSDEKGDFLSGERVFSEEEALGEMNAAFQECTREMFLSARTLAEAAQAPLIENVIAEGLTAGGTRLLSTHSAMTIGQEAIARDLYVHSMEAFAINGPNRTLVMECSILELDDPITTAEAAMEQLEANLRRAREQDHFIMVQIWLDDL
ncbi:hypothetical protein FHY55_00290 [Oceanicola sp. D3]|uniref:hypothetical protein n=1 Tax=Oceanicola sp. D3 TaxID=2587163 RepID=UPI00111D7287|nr:hypothetical protein [Oceanicola sp. D3]QDC07777.1 hypothetical protein FHY55_00290 [Oceanicola sp. D3]